MKSVFTLGWIIFGLRLGKIAILLTGTFFMQFVNCFEFICYIITYMRAIEGIITIFKLRSNYAITDEYPLLAIYILFWISIADLFLWASLILMICCLFVYVSCNPDG